MNQQEQQDAFQADLEALIQRYKDEWGLSVGSAIGVLDIVKLDLWWEQKPEKNDGPVGS